MKDLTTGNKVAIGVIAAVVAALIVLFAVFHRGVFLVFAIVTAVIAVLYFLGTILQKRQEQQDEAVQQTKQTVTMLVIDKKKMKMKEAGLPQQVMDATPKMLRRSKVPIVKAKVGLHRGCHRDEGTEARLRKPEETELAVPSDGQDPQGRRCRLKTGSQQRDRSAAPCCRAFLFRKGEHPWNRARQTSAGLNI